MNHPFLGTSRVGTSRVAGCLYRCHTALKSKAEKKKHFWVPSGNLNITMEKHHL